MYNVHCTVQIYIIEHVFVNKHILMDKVEDMYMICTILSTSYNPTLYVHRVG